MDRSCIKFQVVRGEIIIIALCIALSVPQTITPVYHKSSHFILILALEYNWSRFFFPYQFCLMMTWAGRSKRCKKKNLKLESKWMFCCINYISQCEWCRSNIIIIIIIIIIITLQKGEQRGHIIVIKTTHIQPPIHSHTSSLHDNSFCSAEQTTVRPAWVTDSRRTPDTGMNDLPSSQQWHPSEWRPLLPSTALFRGFHLSSAGLEKADNTREPRS